jgi:hypothetical protein
LGFGNYTYTFIIPSQGDDTLFGLALGRVEPVQKGNYILRSLAVYPVIFLVSGFRENC